MRQLDTHFVEFLTSRSDPFLVRYGAISDVAAWRRRIASEFVPNLKTKEQLGQPVNADIEAFVSLTFGGSRLPMLRKRYSTYLHRQRKNTKAIDLDGDALTALQLVMKQHQLDSYSEAILWMSSEFITPPSS